jgi:hypothetical protein
MVVKDHLHSSSDIQEVMSSTAIMLYLSSKRRMNVVSPLLCMEIMMQKKLIPFFPLQVIISHMMEYG